jgi:hypothetical protein
MFFEFELGCTLIEETYIRLNFFELLFGLGSILYTLRSISNGLVNKFSDFTVDHSMIKKLYTVDKTAEEKSVARKMVITNDQRVLKDALDSRKGLFYSWRQYCERNSIWCSCCRRPESTQDKLFRKARRKLHAEIDILYLIKQMRANSFAVKQVLKPHQLQLVQWFDEYRVKVQPGEEVKSNDDMINYNPAFEATDQFENFADSETEDVI